jgi:hypothetical protein
LADQTFPVSIFADFALQGKWSGARYDDFERQLDALDWWDSLCAAAANVEVVSIERKALPDSRLPRPICASAPRDAGLSRRASVLARCASRKA